MSTLRVRRASQSPITNHQSRIKSQPQRRPQIEIRVVHQLEAGRDLAEDFNWTRVVVDADVEREPEGRVVVATPNEQAGTVEKADLRAREWPLREEVVALREERVVREVPAGREVDG